MAYVSPLSSRRLQWTFQFEKSKSRNFLHFGYTSEMSGKNARKKDAKKQLEERKRKALESVQLPIMPKFEIKPVPQSWLERDRPYLVIGRIPRSSPPELVSTTTASGQSSLTRP